MTEDQDIKGSWSKSDERVFIENLLCTRFNFFLVFFSLVIGGAISTSDQIYFKIILCLGVIIIIPFSLTIARAQKKLDVNLEELFSTEGHPVKIYNDLCRGSFPPSMRQWIGYWIPIICSLVLLIGAILALFGVLLPTSSNC